AKFVFAATFVVYSCARDHTCGIAPIAADCALAVSFRNDGAFSSTRIQGRAVSRRIRAVLPRPGLRDPCAGMYGMPPSGNLLVRDRFRDARQLHIFGAAQISERST